jgi:hypothetical protein
MSDKELEEFRRAAEEFTRKATVSPEAARRVLVEEGIYKPNGELADEYK